MKKNLLLFFLMIFVTLGTSAKEWVFAEQFASTGTVEPLDIKIDGSGNIYIVGNYINALTIGGLAPLPYSDGTAKEDMFICKFDANGNALWARQIASTKKDQFGGLAIDPGDNIYVVGAFQGDELTFQGESKTLLNTQTTGKYDAFLAKYDGSGSLVFADSVFWGDNVQRLNDVAYDFTKNYVVVAGQFQGELKYDSNGVQTLAAVSDKDHLLARFDPSGNYIDKVVLNGQIKQSKYTNVVNCIIADTVNSYFLAGDLLGGLFDAGSNELLRASDTTNADFMVLRFNDQLGFLWGRKGGGSSYDQINSAGSDGFGNVYFTGKAQSTSIVVDQDGSSSTDPITGPDQDYLFAKYNRNGFLQWFKREGGTGTDNAYGISVRGGRILYTGNIDNGGNISSGFAVYDLEGNIIATDSITGDGEESGLNVVFDQSGDSTLVIGTFNGDSLKAGPYKLDNTASGEKDGFLVKYGYEFNIYLADSLNIRCNGAATGSIEVGTEFGTEPVTYVWTPDVSSTNSATGLLAGTYEIIATDDDGRKDTIEIALTQPEAIDIFDVGITGTSCHILATTGNKSNGGVDPTISGGAGGYTYNWAPSGQTSRVLSNVGAGEHRITVTDAYGCVARDTFDVPQPAKISHGGSVVDTIHVPPGDDGAVHLNTYGGTPGYTFSWTGPPGFIPTTEDTLKNLSYGGNYDLQVTDANSCVFDTVFSVPVDTGLNIVICEQIDVSCKDEEDGYAKVCVTLGGSGSYFYAWRTMGGTPVGLNDDELIIGAGTYIVKVTDLVSGSTAEEQVTISEPVTPLTLAVDSVVDVSCQGLSDGAIYISVTNGWGGYTFSWSPTGRTDPDLVGVAENFYTVSVSDTGINSGVCVKQLTNIAVTAPPDLLVTVSEHVQVSCNGLNDGQMIANASGGSRPYFYEWDDPGAQNDSIATDLAAGDYTVSITDANGCTASDQGTLTQPVVLTVSAEEYSAVACFGESTGQMIANVSGGTEPYNYEWNDPGLQTDSIATGLSAGDYTVNITDDHGCVANDMGTVTEPLSEIVLDSVLLVHPSTGDSDDGSITAYVSGGTPPYQYSFNGGAYGPENDTTSLDTGIYIINIKDAKGCGPVSSTDTLERLNVGIEQMDYREVSIYPNPNNGRFTLELGNPEGEDTDLQVINLLGKVVYRKHFIYDGTSRFIQTIDLGEQARGVYFLRVNELPVKIKIMIE